MRISDWSSDVCSSDLPVTKVVTIIDTALPDAEPRKDYVRIVKSHQQWRLTPTADGQTTVQIQLLSDPGGIPAALINAMSVSSPFNPLSNLRKLAKQPKYAKDRKSTRLNSSHSCAPRT